MKDQAVINEAGQIIAEYLEPGPRTAEATLDRLIPTLDNQPSAEALERLGRLFHTDPK